MVEGKISQKEAGIQMPLKNEEFKNRIMEKKWKSLEARGIHKPKDKEENDKLAKEAHGF